LALLRCNPDVTRLYVALLVAFAADWFATVALIDLALETTDSTAAASFILVLQTAPFLVATPIAGMLADRPERRLMLAGANVARGVVCIGLLFATDSDTVWIAFAVVAVLAFGAAFFEPTVSDSLPKFVEREDLPTANALIRSAWGTMVAFGAASGGLVAATVGREVTFLMYALLRGISLSFVVYLVGYALLPLSPVIWAAAVFVFVGHVGGGAQWTLSSFGLQRATPDRIRGRVFAVDFGLALAISSVSASIAGWLAGAIGPLPTLYVMLGAVAVTVAVWFRWTGPVRRGPKPPGPVLVGLPPHAAPEPPI
jgi:MFS family permease